MRANSEQFTPAQDKRTVALDGLRGATTLMVLFSHYFAEVPNGIRGLSVGWIAVVTFFVLSGFLIGRLILERQHHANFYSVFYARRAARMLPPFVITIAAVTGLFALVGHHHWAEATPAIPALAYLTFTQNFFMISLDSIGPHWLAPTWTLTVEEHFYLLAPITIIWTPRRHLLKTLIAAGIAAVALRYAIFFQGVTSTMTGRVMLPAIADSLIAGIIAAELHVTKRIDWARFGLLLRASPIVLLLVSGILCAIDGHPDGYFAVFGTTLISIAAACVILALVYGAPEAKRFESKILCFFGHNSYTIYLTHLTVLGLMHGLILGSTPDLATWQQAAVTIAALPVAVAVGWVLFRFVEEPATAYGRNFRWSKDVRATGRAEAPASTQGIPAPALPAPRAMAA